jgi:hypothetical protein
MKDRLQSKCLVCLFIAAMLVASMGAVETLAQRRRQVQAMSNEQLNELFRSKENFDKLLPQDQQRIRDLHDQLENDPDRDKLRGIMNRYCKWFETQPLFRRTKLLDRTKTTKERVATVKEYLNKPAAPAKDIHLDDKNRRALSLWLESYVAEHAERFKKGMAQGFYADISKLPPDRQQAALRDILLSRRWQMGGPNGRLPLSEDEKTRLLAVLSPDLRSKLEAKSPGDQSRILGEWLRETASHELDEQLLDFFENSIDIGERDRLMSLPSEEMFHSLNEQYGAQLTKSKSAERPRGDHPPKQHGRRPSDSPWGSDGRHGPENHDEKDPDPGKDTKAKG